jgi:hypothetical protein
MKIEREIKKRIRRRREGLDLDLSINAAIAGNIGESTGSTATAATNTEESDPKQS